MCEKQESLLTPLTNYFFMKCLMIKAIINAHIITSPNITMNPAPTTKPNTIVTIAITNNNVIKNVNNIIIQFLLKIIFSL